MNPLSYLNKKLESAIANLYEQNIDSPLVTPPTDRTKAHYTSNIAFSLAKTLKKSPLAVCEELAKALEPDENFDISFLAPGFLNFNLKNPAAHNLLALVAENDQYGANDILKNQNWAIEHTSPNPNKAMHLGHLRNNLVGMSLAALVEFCGAAVTRDWIDNDRGIAISKAMLGYLLFKRKDDTLEPTVEAWFDNPKNWFLPSDTDEKSDRFVDNCYVLASDAIKKDENLKNYASELTVRWEANDEKVRALWKLIIDLGHTGQAETLRRLGNRWDHAWHEHEHYLQGKRLVEEGLKKGIFRQLEDGAILTNLENYNLPDTILQKSDGTSLYITQDLALTKLKKDKYQADKLFWVIGPEQSVAMKQVFAVCEQLGIGKLSDFIHIPFGLVSITDEDGKKKKMSSRDGGVIYTDDLLDAVKASLLTNNERNYSDPEAEKIAVAAIKFALLSLGRMTDTAINIEKILNQNGDTGVYVLYTRARLLSLLRSSGTSGSEHAVAETSGGSAEAKRDDPATAGVGDAVSETAFPSGATFSAEEKDLTALLSYLPEIIKSSLEDLTTNRLADFLLDLSHAFNHLYATERFLTDNREETAKKLLLTRATLQAFDSALKVLSITPVEKI
jgi:arginyl-tRNA synthetase